MAEKEPANTLNLAGSLPPDAHNGLKALLPALIADPGERRYGVVEFYGLYDKRNTDDGTHQIIVRWTRIEPVFDDDAALVQKLLDAGRTARMGELDFTGPLEPEGGQVHNITDARRRAASDGEE